MKTIVGITEKLNDIEFSQLNDFAAIYNKVLHHLYVDLFIKKLKVKDLCPAYQEKYKISKRHFDSIRKALEGKVSSILALNKTYIVETKEKIKKVEKDLSQQVKNYRLYKNKDKDKETDPVKLNLKKSLQSKIQYNRNRLARLKVKLKNLESIQETGNVSLCFGSNRLFRQQFLINTKNNSTEFKTHQDWLKSWQYQRNKEFTLVGSKDETAGNLNAQISYVKENKFNLKINLNNSPIDKLNLGNKYINIQFTINHELNTLKQIILNNQGKDKALWQALTFKLIKQNSKRHENKYTVSISFEKHLNKKVLSSKDKGCIGVDINQDHLAVSDVDKNGNLISVKTFPYDLNGNKDPNKNSISLAVKGLMEFAVQLNKPIVIEKLDFSQKKRNLSLNKSKSNFSKNKNKQLNSLAYSKITELIKARAQDNFLEVKEVNPAYTSIIGSIKYSPRCRISNHHGAAMCIARKGLNLREKKISSRNKHIKVSDLPARNNLKPGAYWTELKEIMGKSKKLRL